MAWKWNECFVVSSSGGKIGTCADIDTTAMAYRPVFRRYSCSSSLCCSLALMKPDAFYFSVQSL